MEGTRLLVSPGQAGATGNIYAGLHELSEMGFVLHLLREGDLFADVGANIGSYTILAAGSVGAHVISFEPGGEAFRILRDNVRLNDLGALVEIRNEAVGASVGEVDFTEGGDTVNRVALPSETRRSTRVSMNTLDNALAGRIPAVMKIDVEGFESRVIAGASATIADQRLQAIIIETNGSGTVYGANDSELHAAIIQRGFTACAYDPFARKLTTVAAPSASGNTIYARDIESASRRVEVARKFSIAGHGFL